MGVLTIIVIIFHVFVSLGLVVAVLLHSGKGGGLSSMMGGGGGGGSGSVFSGSYIVEKNLDRITIVLASVFSVTTLLLLWLMAPK